MMNNSYKEISSHVVLRGGWLVESHWFLGIVLEFSCLPYPHNNLHSVVLFFYKTGCLLMD